MNSNSNLFRLIHTDNYWCQEHSYLFTVVNVIESKIINRAYVAHRSGEKVRHPVINLMNETVE